MTIDVPAWALVLPTLVVVAVLVLGVLAFVPATAPVVRPIWRNAGGWLAGAAGIAGGWLLMLLAWRMRTKPTRESEQPDTGTDLLDAEARARRAETQAALEGSLRRAAEAVAAPDSAAGWADIDAEEAALDEALLRNREPRSFTGRGRP